MTHRLFRLWIAALMMSAWALPAYSQTANDISSLTTILSDQRIWGRDLPTVAASVQAARDIGENGIVVFSDRIIGATPYAQPADAMPKATRVQEIFRRTLPAFKPPFAALATRDAESRHKLVTTRVERTVEDGKYRLTTTAAEAEFLKPGLTIANVESWYGKPERIERQVIQSEGERRPVVLTLHYYANGSIAFVEWDLAPEPGVVNRVMISVAAASHAMFQEGQ